MTFNVPIGVGAHATALQLAFEILSTKSWPRFTKEEIIERFDKNPYR
jgi:hypothetical protein